MMSFKVVSAENIFITHKINNEIISNIDIEKEKKYLLALNNQLKNLNEEKILKIARESHVKEVVKKIELEKYFFLDQKNPLLERVIKNFYIKLGFNNETEFKKYLNLSGLTINYVKKKIEIETTWNKLIYDKYENQIDVNEKKLIERIKNIKSKESTKKYSLSEILFELNVGEKLKDKTNKINMSINEIGFKNTANSFSISDSAKFGGYVGWVEEKNLNVRIFNTIKNLKIGNHSKPVQISNGFLILRIDNIKKEKNIINEKNELEKMIVFEKNKQLERFSKIYYDKVKINSSISEK